MIRRLIREPHWRWVLRARVLRPWRALNFHSFGTASVLHRPAWVYGAHKIAVGDGVLTLHGLWLSVERPAWEREEPVIRLGDRVGIRPYCTISAAESVVLEDDVIVSAFTSIIDSDHTFGAPGDEPVNVMFNPLETSPIRIGAGTWIGERVAVLRGSDIGRHCAIGANSVVRGTIPDFSVAVGAPARVVGTTRPDLVDR